MTADPRTIWVHRPAQGAVAWLAAVVTVPVSPVALVWIHTMVSAARDGESPNHLGAVLVAVWAVIGVLLAALPGHRVVRGTGAGMIAGAGACLATLGVWGWL